MSIMLETKHEVLLYGKQSYTRIPKVYAWHEFALGVIFLIKFYQNAHEEDKNQRNF